MFLGRKALALGAHELQRLYQPNPRFGRLDNAVDVAAARGNVGIVQELFIFFDPFLSYLFRLPGSLYILVVYLKFAS